MSNQQKVVEIGAFRVPQSNDRLTMNVATDGEERWSLGKSLTMLSIFCASVWVGFVVILFG